MKLVFAFLLTFFFGVAAAQFGGITVPTGHASGGGNLKLDKSKKYLFSAEYSKVIMWEVRTGTQLYSFKTQGEKLLDYAVSPDGKRLVLSTERHALAYSTETGKLLWKTEGMSDYKSVVFAESGLTLYGLRQMGYEASLHSVDPLTGAVTATLIKEIGTQSDMHLTLATPGQLLLWNAEGWWLLNEGTSTLPAAHRLPTGHSLYSYLPGRKAFISLAEAGGKKTYRIRGVAGQDSAVLWRLERWERPGILIPAQEEDAFLVVKSEEDGAPQKITLYSGKVPVAKLLPATYSGPKLVSGGLFTTVQNPVYLTHWSEFSEIDLATGKGGPDFKREVADLGISVFNTMTYSYLDGKAHLMTEDSLLKSIDLARMSPYRHANLSVHTEMVAISPSGDTVGVFDSDVAFLKNTNDRKRLAVALPAAKGASSNDRDCFFFSADGSKLFYATFSVPAQKSTLKSYDFRTKAVKNLAVAGSFSNVFVHPDKTVIAYVDGNATDYAVKVVNLETGALLLNLKPPADKGGTYVFISSDKKTLLLAGGNYTLNYYSIATGKPVPPYTTQEHGGFYSNAILKASTDLTTIVTGNDDGRLTAYNTDGSMRFNIQAHEAGIRDILFSPDNKLMYSVSYDQSIKTIRTATGEVLGTLYLFKDGNDYVFLGKDGRFDGSPGGMKRLYYIKNRQKLSLDLVYEKYYTPNLYQRLVNGERMEPIPEINLAPAPKVSIAYNATRNLDVGDDVPTVVVEGATASVTVEATAQEDRIDEIRVFQNGKVVRLTTRNLIVEEQKGDVLRKTYELQLQPGQNSVRAIALNTQRTESEPAEIILVAKRGAADDNPVVNGPTKTTSSSVVAPVDRNATLHLVVVGINQYSNPAMSLNYALADATAFKTQLEANVRSMTESVKTYFVTDAAANKEGISKAFAAVQSTAKPEDVFVFYYAGHGVIGKDKEFYLVPNDVSDLKNVQAELAQKGIAASRLQQYAIDIKAQKQLFILDACQSAGAFEKLLSSNGDQQKNIALVARSTGTHWMAASGSQQFANEFSALGHGAFTYVLLEALKGKALQNKMVTVNGLKTFLQAGVPELMKKYNGAAQYPASYGAGADFPVEVKR